MRDWIDCIASIKLIASVLEDKGRWPELLFAVECGCYNCAVICTVKACHASELGSVLGVHLCLHFVVPLGCYGFVTFAVHWVEVLKWHNVFSVTSNCLLFPDGSIINIFGLGLLSLLQAQSITECVYAYCVLARWIRRSFLEGVSCWSYFDCCQLFCIFTVFVSWWFWFDCQYQCKWSSRKTNFILSLWSDFEYVDDGGVKPCSFIHGAPKFKWYVCVTMSCCMPGDNTDHF